jgi:hypothetical protein
LVIVHSNSFSAPLEKLSKHWDYDISTGEYVEENVSKINLNIIIVNSQKLGILCFYCKDKVIWLKETSPSLLDPQHLFQMANKINGHGHNGQAYVFGTNKGNL